MLIPDKHGGIKRIIAVSGGKGGVGKTCVAINLSVALAALSQRVLLLDADMGLANVDVLLNLSPKLTIADLLNERASLEEVILAGPRGIGVIPSQSGSRELAHAPMTEMMCLIEAIAKAHDAPDVLIIDTAAGIADNVLTLTTACHEVLVVVCNDPASLADAYALIKLLHVKYAVKKFRIVANKVRSGQESREIFTKLTNVTDRFLTVSLHLAGFIPTDRQLERAIARRSAVVELYPSAKSAQAFEALAQTVLQWPRQVGLSGALNFTHCELLDG